MYLVTAMVYGLAAAPPPFPLVLKNFEQNAHDEKYGDRGLPCRTQRVRLKKSEDEPLFITQL